MSNKATRIFAAIVCIILVASLLFSLIYQIIVNS